MVALRWDEYSPGKLRLSPLVYPSCSIRTTKTKVAYHLIHSLRKQLLSSSTGRRHGWCCLVCSHLPAGLCDSETQQGDLTWSDARHARLSLNRTQQAQNNGRAACTQSAAYARSLQAKNPPRSLTILCTHPHVARRRSLHLKLLWLHSRMHVLLRHYAHLRGLRVASCLHPLHG